MIKTKCILNSREESDGLRISIMSRHTLDDGETPHPEINKRSYDWWMPSLAPPLKLVGSYYRGETQWDQFESEYLEYIGQAKIQAKIQGTAKRGLTSNLTLLCIEESPEKCHRRLLAEECQKYQSSLILKIE